MTTGAVSRSKGLSTNAVLEQKGGILINTPIGWLQWALQDEMVIFLLSLRLVVMWGAAAWQESEAIYRVVPAFPGIADPLLEPADRTSAAPPNSTPCS